MTLYVLNQTHGIPEDVMSQYILAARVKNEVLLPKAGVLRQAVAAQKQGKKGIFVHPDQAQEAAIVTGLSVLPLRTLEEVQQYLLGNLTITPIQRDTRMLFAQEQQEEPYEIAEIIEDENTKHALEIAVIGRHPSVLFGHFRSGKRRLAEHTLGMMPHLSLKEALVVTLRYSDTGELPLGSGLLAHRQLRLISPVTSPEEVYASLFLSHLGVLLLQDPQEFNQQVLGILQETLQTKQVYWKGQHVPCRPQVIALCPHALLPESLIPHFDLYIKVPIISPEDHSRFADIELESSQEIRERIEAAKQWQELRYEDHETIRNNGDIPLTEAQDWVTVDKQALQFASISLRNLRIDTAVLPQAFRVAQSIADRVGQPKPFPYHSAEAIHYLHPRFEN